MLEVNTRRNFSAHHMLIAAARIAVNGAAKKRPGCGFDPLIAITFSALALEALCNAVGARLIDRWKDFESASPIAKLRLLCSQLDIEFDPKSEPWSTTLWLAKVRNQLAHAKPELIIRRDEVQADHYEKWRDHTPNSALEAELTTGNAKRAYNAAEKIKQLLCDKIPTDRAFGLYSDAWTRDASPLLIPVPPEVANELQPSPTAGESEE